MPERRPTGMPSAHANNAIVQVPGYLSSLDSELQDRGWESKESDPHNLGIQCCVSPSLVSLCQGELHPVRGARPGAVRLVQHALPRGGPRHHAPLLHHCFNIPLLCCPFHHCFCSLLEVSGELLKLL